jgi:signal transduction histidine kinase
MGIVLRPQPLPLGAGIIVAAAFISVETAVVYWLQHMGSDKSFRAIFLLGVVVVSAACGLRMAVATTVVSALVYFYFHLEHPPLITGDDFFALFVFLPIALSANILGWQARLQSSEAEERRREADDAASLARSLADQQTALRRVATLVARGIALDEIYPAAVFELSRGLRVENVVLLKYGRDRATVVAGSRDDYGKAVMCEGEHVSLDGDSVAALILRHGRAARMDTYAGATGPTAAHVRSLGLQSASGAPILVGGRIWGALVVGSARAGSLPPGTELRIQDFADLVSTAIANAETRGQLTASRARIVAAGDQARQRFERDLHDGAQQHVVSLGLQLRAVQLLVEPDQHQLNEQMSLVVAGLGTVAAELRELSQGMHPAILSRGGLRAAIKSLARRCALPVALELDIGTRLQEQVEVAAYYFVAEALTNAVKYARASEVAVRASIEEGDLRLTVSDNGIGGAVVGDGSGLIGLKDRVEVLAGQFEIVSSDRLGTTLTASIPLATHGGSSSGPGGRL